MKHVSKVAIAAAGAFIGASASWADTLLTHRIPAALAVEAASETIPACARQGYHETAVVLDADGTTIMALRGDGAGIHTLDSAHDKAYTSWPTRSSVPSAQPARPEPSSTTVAHTRGSTKSGIG